MLDNIRVLDLTMHLSGPYCCWLLASLGADVIKIERPNGGDPVREVGPHVHGQSTYFGSVNRNKRGIVLDLKQEEGRSALEKLILSADVLVENFRPGVLARLGFSEDRIKELNPDMIYASISGFGQEGPMSRRPAFDIVIQAMSGFMSLTGSPKGPPTSAGISVADITSGLFTALDVAAALYQRERTGAVRRIDIAMMDCQLALMEHAAARYFNTTEQPSRVGNRHPKITPFQPYPTRDSSIVVAADGEPNWQRMCAAMGLESLANEPKFATNADRVNNYDELENILSNEFRKNDSKYWLDLLERADVPCGPINSISEWLSNEYLKLRNMKSTIDLPGRGSVDYIASPIGLKKNRKERSAPQLGEHTDEILEEFVVQKNMYL